MSQDTWQGHWRQIRGKVREHWGRLTDDDLDVIRGRRDQLVGRLQERYGYGRDEAEQEVDRFRDRWLAERNDPRPWERDPRAAARGDGSPWDDRRDWRRDDGDPRDREWRERELRDRELRERELRERDRREQEQRERERHVRERRDFERDRAFFADRRGDRDLPRRDERWDDRDRKVRELQDRLDEERRRRRELEDRLELERRARGRDRWDDRDYL